MALKIEMLDSSVHDRADFTNRDAEIELFLKRKANKEHKQSISDTYVLVDSSRLGIILGYFTLSNSALELTNLPPKTKKNLPKYKSLGTVLLCRMGRNYAHTSSGYGAIILREAIKESLKRGTFYALEVHAKNQKLKDFYHSFGFISTLEDDLHMILPRKTIIAAMHNG